MPLKVVIDSSAFLYAFEFPESNSRKIIELLNKGKLEAVISERVLLEVVRYFHRYHGEQGAKQMRRYLTQTCILIATSLIADTMKELKGTIKDKDLEQISAARKLGCAHLIALDRDFVPFREYITPKEFITFMRMKPADTEF